MDQSSREQADKQLFGSRITATEQLGNDKADIGEYSNQLSKSMTSRTQQQLNKAIINHMTVQQQQTNKAVTAGHVTTQQHMTGQRQQLKVAIRDITGQQQIDKAVAGHMTTTAAVSHIHGQQHTSKSAASHMKSQQLTNKAVMTTHQQQLLNKVSTNHVTIHQPTKPPGGILTGEHVEISAELLAKLQQEGQVG